MVSKSLRRPCTVFLISLGSLLACAVGDAQESSSAGTTRFVLDGNRMYAELGFVLMDGSVHRALAFVDMGSGSMTLRESLFRKVQLDQGHPLRFKVGELSVEVPGAEVSSEGRDPYSVGSGLKVEGMLPAGVLQRYRVVIDYQNRTLSLSQTRTPTPLGVSHPFRINRKTGLIAVEASIGGNPYLVTVDNGSAYTWFSQNTAKKWLAAHPDWERGVGAVGASNMMMSGDGTETSGILLRIPEISLGSLRLKDVGALAAGPSRSFPGDLDLFDWYSQKNAAPVIGWIGGNVLKAFRVTIDYPNQMTYWFEQSGPDSHDLDQVGLTLRFGGGGYFVAAIAAKDGNPTVEGVLPGDKLIRVGELEVEKASWGAIYEAMHGQPGETRALVLERDGHRATVAAKVIGF